MMIGSTFLLTLTVTYLAQLNEVVTGSERVLDTPLPAAYSIAIAQIAWIYVLVLPFQLYDSLGWITIPGSIGKTAFHSLQYSL
jgi:predicted membrane chloride channel (bestrophin family)